MMRTLTILALLQGCDEISSDTAGRSAPNLLVSGFYVERSGSDYVFTVLVENDGERDADTFAVDLFLDRSSEPAEGQSGDATERVGGGLAAGEVTTVTFSVSQGATAQGATAWVLVDSAGEVDEAWEDDNSARTEVTDRRR